MHGIICMWSGAFEDIPDGWALCDGTNGTPDLRTKFIFTAGHGIVPMQKGGRYDHRHVVTVGAHEHSHSASALPASPSLDSGDKIINSEPDGHYMEQTYEHTHDITVQAQMHDHDTTVDIQNHFPPWYALALIMKL